MPIRFIERTKEYFLHHGQWRRGLTLYQAIALIVGANIGAGILGVPFAVAKVGIWVGVFYIVSIGLLTAGINLMIGEVSTRTTDNLQVVGLTKKYLGKYPGLFMSGLFYSQLFAIITIYVIAEGHILASLLPGSAFVWSLCFWAVGSLVVYFGLGAIKNAEVVLTSFIVLSITVIVLLGFPHLNTDFYKISDMSLFFLPYGVILFAFSGIGTVPAAYRFLQGDNVVFKKAITISSLITIAVYILFTFTVIGVTGAATTEIATIGLGQAINKTIFYFANLFAFLAMCTSFLMLSMELRDSLNWDFRFSYRVGTAIALGVPLILFILGLRQFILAMDLVGGIFVSLEMFLIILVYWKAKSMGDVEPADYKLHHAFLVAGLALAAFFIGAVSSVWGLF
jgi:amino acid permease